MFLKLFNCTSTLQLPMQPVHITTDFVSLNLDQGWGVQHYVIKVASDLQQVGGFLSILQFPLPIKLIDTILLKYPWSFVTQILLRNG